METMIVGIIVALAAVYTGYRLFRPFYRKKHCGADCGCGSKNGG